MKTLERLAADLATGKASSCSLLEQCLDRASDLDGEGARVFISLHRESARAEAEAADRARHLGRSLSPYAGIPISIKDLFDIAGQTTTAGSRVLDNNPPALADAPAVARLRAAGFVIVGKTNMTEFAYSGLGVNDHFGTPKNPYDRSVGRIPGGSTSGGAVSVTDGMSHASLGTDTGGSCRIPAALTGIVGFKPTARRIPTEGAVPLSFTQDSIGPLARSVHCCAVIDSVLARDGQTVPEVFPLRGVRLGAVQDYVLEGMDDTVARAYERSLSYLSQCGAQVIEVACPQLQELPEINAKGGFVGAEAYAWHRTLLEARGDYYDPWVRSRFEAGKSQSAADYLDVCQARQRLMSQVNEISSRFDAFVMPTVPLVAPPLQAMTENEVRVQTNRLLLRNTSIGNFLDRCAISLPCHTEGEAPVGMMLMGETGGDQRLLAVALGVEQALSSQ